LGTDDGVGPWTVVSDTGVDIKIESWTLTAAGLDTIVSGILGGSGTNGITDGTVNTSGLTAITGSGPTVGSTREFLDFICALAGAEYRMNPDLTMDFATAANLFVTTPTTVVTRTGAGPDGTVRGIPAPNLSQTTSARQIVTEVQVVQPSGLVDTSTSGLTAPVGPTNGSTRFIKRLAADSNGNISTSGEKVLALYESQRKKVTLDSSEFAVTRFVSPGDYVYLYAPESGLYDTANQVEFRGITMQPIKLRLKTVTWPFEAGMGCYLRSSAATATYVDISDWVTPEAGGGFGDEGDGTSSPFNFATGGASPGSAPTQPPAPAAPQGTPGGIAATQAPLTGPAITTAAAGGASADRGSGASGPDTDLIQAQRNKNILNKFLAWKQEHGG
jgi:hypothetical protein